MFTSLEPTAEFGRRRGVWFLCGLLAQVLIILVTVFVGLLFPGELPFTDRRIELTWLPAVTPPPKPVVKMPRELPRAALPKLQSPPPPKVVASSAPVYEVPKTPRAITPPPATIATLPPPVQPTPAPKVKEQEVVRTGVFGGAAEPVTTRRRVEQVQTGGFGNPEGLPGKAKAENTGNTPILGSFGLPSGPGHGNGSGGNHGVQGVVVSVGFGSGIASVANGRGDGENKVVASAGFSTVATGTGNGHGDAGPVAVGGFEKTRTAAPPPPKTVQAPQPVDFQPIEIISKPAPNYTEEALRLKIEGEVALTVVFQADGSIRVTGVVRSLGHGLDQEAEQAASQIRFKPAQRAGQPTDVPATLRIEFRLAGQPS